MWTFSSPEGGAAVFKPPAGDGALLSATYDRARGDLLSSKFSIDPFTLLEVKLQYIAEIGAPLLFLCCRPVEKPTDVDLAFLPQDEIGKTVTESVMLHTSRSADPHAVAVSITGKGVARLLSITLKVVGKFNGCNRPLFVVDLLHDTPPKDGKLGWTNIERLVNVFGFSRVDYAHFSKVTDELLNTLDPALIVLSPSSSQSNSPKREGVFAALRACIKTEKPMVGICYGHQWLARLYGKKIYQSSESGTVLVKALKQDPLFEGLPRFPNFYVSQSHNWAVYGVPDKAELLASSRGTKCQILRYKGKPWITTQFHFERGWELNTPEAVILWKNILNEFKLAGQQDLLPSRKAGFRE